MGQLQITNTIMCTFSHHAELGFPFSPIHFMPKFMLIALFNEFPVRNM